MNDIDISKLLQLVLGLIPSLKGFASQIPEAIEFGKGIYALVAHVIELAKAKPLDAEGEAALDALIEWQSHTPYGSIEVSGPAPTPTPEPGGDPVIEPPLP